MTLKPPPYRLKLLSHQCLTEANAKAVNVVSIIIAMFKFKKKNRIRRNMLLTG